MKTKFISNALNAKLFTKIFQMMERNYLALVAGILMLLVSSLLSGCDSSWYALTGGGPYRDNDSYNQYDPYAQNGLCLSNAAPTLKEEGMLNGEKTQVPLDFLFSKIESVNNEDVLTMTFQSNEKIEKGAKLEKLSFISAQNSNKIIEFTCVEVAEAEFETYLTFQCKPSLSWYRSAYSMPYEKTAIIKATLRERYANESLVMIYAELSSNLGFQRFGSQYYKSGSTVSESSGLQWQSSPCTVYELGSYGVKIDDGHVIAVEMDITLKTSP